MIIVLIVFLVGCFFGLAILLAMYALHLRSKSKERAREIIGGAISTPKEINKIKKILSVATNDTEASHLWHKLEELNQK